MSEEKRDRLHTVAAAFCVLCCFISAWGNPVDGRQFSLLALSFLASSPRGPFHPDPCEQCDAIESALVAHGQRHREEVEGKWRRLRAWALQSQGGCKMVELIESATPEEMARYKDNPGEVD